MRNYSTFFISRKSVLHFWPSRVKTLLLLALLPFAACCQASLINCPASDKTQKVHIAHIFDGDTVRLADGRRIRLIGVNTPELSHNNKVDQPLAQEAKDFVHNFFKPNFTAQLQLGTQQQDRYGRWLGHLFNQNNQNLESALLARGLGFHILIPQNTSLAECLAAAEQQAKLDNSGLWQQANLAPFRKLEPGYKRITGVVDSIQFSKSWWVSFKNGHLANFVAVINNEAQNHISKKTAKSWIEKTIEIEGWIYFSSYNGQPQLRLNLHTIDAVSVTDNLP